MATFAEALTEMVTSIAGGTEPSRPVRELLREAEDATTRMVQQAQEEGRLLEVLENYVELRMDGYRIPLAAAAAIDG